MTPGQMKVAGWALFAVGGIVLAKLGNFIGIIPLISGIALYTMGWKEGKKEKEYHKRDSRVVAILLDKDSKELDRITFSSKEVMDRWYEIVEDWGDIASVKVVPMSKI